MNQNGNSRGGTCPPHQQEQSPGQQQKVTFSAPEGRYMLLSDRQQNAVAYNPQRSTKLTPAHLSVGNEVASYLIYNVAEALIVSQTHMGGKDVIRTILFGTASQGGAVFPTSHSHLETSDGFDLVVGLSNGEVMVGSLRLQLQSSMSNTRFLNSQHYNPEGIMDNSRITQVEWSRQSEGQMFVVAHASGALYLYAKVQSQPEVDNSQLVGPAPVKTLKNSPVGNIPVHGGMIHDFSFSPDGTKLATVTRDGFMRVFEFPSGPLITGFKSYYGGLLCVAWSHDGKYIATGGEDDLVAVFGLQEGRVIVWGEGHNSWVSAVSFDPVLSDVADGKGSGPSYYRIGSVGQDTQVMFWDVVVEDEPQSPGANGLDCNNPASSVQEAQPRQQPPRHGSSGIAQTVPHSEMPFMPPVIQCCWHTEPMSAILFTSAALATACQGGLVKCWRRPATNPAARTEA